MEHKIIFQKIQSFCLLKDDIVYSTIDHKIYLNDELLYESDKDIQQIHFNGLNAYTNTIYGDSLEINVENKKIEYTQNNFLKYLDPNFKIISQGKNSVIQNLKENIKIIKPFKLFIYLINKEKLIYYAGNNLTAKNLSINSTSLISNEDYFSFPLSSLNTLPVDSKETSYKVSEFCDIYKNILITTFTNGDILLLDIEKGKPIKLLEDTKIKEGLFQKEENSSVYLGLKFKTYIEIDVEKQEIIKQLDLEEYFKKKFNRSILVPINTTIYRNGLIYFIADTNIVGVFNPKTIDVVDFYEFEFENKQTILKGGKE